MKICIQCNSVFTDEQFFCLNDGTRLIDAEAEQETIVTKRADPPSQENISFTEKTTACPACALENRASSRFCKKCGAVLPVSPSVENKIFTPDSEINFQLPQNDPAAAPNQSQPQPLGFPNAESQPSPEFGETVAFRSPVFTPPASEQYRPGVRPGINKFLVGGVLLGLVLVGGIAWLFLRAHPLEAKLDAAISSNKLIEPAGDNAYDHYQQMKKDGVKPEILKKYEDRLFPLLTEKPAEILKTVTEPGYTEKRPEEWQDAAKMLEWASEMPRRIRRLGQKPSIAGDGWNI